MTLIIDPRLISQNVIKAKPRVQTQNPIVERIIDPNAAPIVAPGLKPSPKTAAIRRVGAATAIGGLGWALWKLLL